VTKMSVPVTAEEKTNKKNDVKARSLLLMALPNEHQLTFSQYNDAKTIIASFSDNAVYAFMVENPNGSNLLQQDLEQIYEDDLEAIDLKWQLSLLSMRAKRYFQRIGMKIFINANDTAGYDKSKIECFNRHKMGHFARECRAPKNKEGQFRNQDNTRKHGNNKDTSSKAMLAIDGVGFDWSDMAEEQVQTNMALMAFSDSEVYNDKTVLSNKRFTQTNNTAKAKAVNSARPKAVNTARPHSTVVNAVRVNQGKPQQDDTGFIDSGCSRHMTGNIAYLLDFKEFDGGYVTFGGGAHGGRISGKGTLKTDSLDFKDVYFVNELKFNLFSVSQMCDKKNYVLFTDTECLALSPNFNWPDERKQHRASCKSKVLNPITKPLFMLHMDLFGPTYVSSLMHKKYCLVVTDDYSRFTWVFFLTTKDETSEILKNFIKEIENLVDKKVKIIRSDNGTEFKNKVLDDFCREKGIKREYSVAGLLGKMVWLRGGIGH
ncbi:putative ribonuclease H-like domain-containing protein, partial [Tanacetum coccineum]